MELKEVVKIIERLEMFRLELVYTSEQIEKDKRCLKVLLEQLKLHGVVFNEAETIDKQVQAKLIEQIMKADEELGLYSEVELCECGGNKRVGLDCTMKPCKHPYYKK